MESQLEMGFLMALTLVAVVHFEGKGKERTIGSEIDDEVDP